MRQNARPKRPGILKTPPRTLPLDAAFMRKLSIFTRLTGLAVLVVTGGCTVGPDYHKPAPPLPRHWLASPDSPASLKPAADTVKNWWQSFGDHTLNQLMTQAFSGNPDLRLALARIAEAQAERGAIRAELFPQVGGTANAQHQNNPFPGFAPGIRFNLFQAGFDALWEIDLFGRQQRRLEAASAGLDAAGEDYAAVWLTLTADIARSYVEYRSVQQQLLTTRANLSAQQQSLQLTEHLYREGVATRHDVVRARALVARTGADVPDLESGQLAALRQLELLLGRQPGALADLLEPVAAVPNAPYPDHNILTTPADILRQRPDIRNAERKLAAATAMQGAAVAEMFPKISLSAFLGLRNTELETLFKSAAFSWSTGAGLLQPLLDFGRIRAGIHLADARQQEASLSFETTVLEALRDVEVALTRYLKALLKQQNLGRSVDDLRESAQLARLRYQEGVASFLEVLDAERSLHTEDLALTRARADTSIQLVAVYKALGGGAEPPRD